MRYQVTLHPVEGSIKNALTLIGADGVAGQTRNLGEISVAQITAVLNFVTSLAKADNNGIVATAAVANTVQPSVAQQAGLLAYLAAIQAGTNTAAVETAIGLL